MPFELTHIVVAQQVLKQLEKPLTPQLLGGVIYPDVRYPAKIDRRLTHTMDGLPSIALDDFAFGVHLHLETDRVWDEIVLLDKPGDAGLIGGLKLIHDTVSDKMFENRAQVMADLTSSRLLSGSPVTEAVWRDWVNAIKMYIEDGANQMGWQKIIVKMGFMSEVDLIPRLEMVGKMIPKYISEIEEKHQLIVEQVCLSYLK